MGRPQHRDAALRELQLALTGVVRTLQSSRLRQSVANQSSQWIKPPYSTLLGRIVEAPQTQARLVGDLDRDQSTLSRHIALLEEHGYVKRVANPNDGRTYHLIATEAGRAVYEAHLDAWLDVFADVTKVLSDSHLDELVAHLAAFTAELEDFASGIDDVPSPRRPQ